VLSKKFDTSLKEFEEIKDKKLIDDAGPKIVKVLEGITKYLPNLKTGIETNDPIIISSSLIGMVGPVISVAGPYGAAIGGVMNLFSGILGLFGKKQESIEKVINKILDKAVDKILDGVKQMLIVLEEQILCANKVFTIE
jgi:hypothetical protein